MSATGVYPVFDIGFKVNTAGRTGLDASLAIVADMETFEPSIDGKVIEWNPMDTQGWIRRLMTGKGFSIKLSGKRNVGDPGNDYVAGLGWMTGTACSTKAAIVFPDGDTLKFDCIVNVSKNFGGASTDASALDFELLSDGAPVYIDNSLFAALTFLCVDGTAAGATKISAVVPVLTAGNSYMYKVNGALPGYNESIVGKAWAPYALAADIPVITGNAITLIEVTAGNLAVKGGSSPAVVV